MSVQRAPQLQALQQEARTRPRSPLSPRNPNVTSHGGGGKPSADSPLKPPGSTRSWIREMNNAVFTPAASSRLQRRVSSPASTKAGSSAHPATAAVDGAGNGKQLRFDSPVLATPTPSDASLRSAVKTPGTRLRALIVQESGKKCLERSPIESINPMTGLARRDAARGPEPGSPELDATGDWARSEMVSQLLQSASKACAGHESPVRSRRLQQRMEQQRRSKARSFGEALAIFQQGEAAGGSKPVAPVGARGRRRSSNSTRRRRSSNIGAIWSANMQAYRVRQEVTEMVAEKAEGKHREVILKEEPEQPQQQSVEAAVASAAVAVATAGSPTLAMRSPLQSVASSPEDAVVEGSEERHMAAVPPPPPHIMGTAVGEEDKAAGAPAAASDNSNSSSSEDDADYEDISAEEDDSASPVLAKATVSGNVQLPEVQLSPTVGIEKFLNGSALDELAYTHHQALASAQQLMLRLRSRQSTRGNSSEASRLRKHLEQALEKIRDIRASKHEAEEKLDAAVAEKRVLESQLRLAKQRIANMEARADGSSSEADHELALTKQEFALQTSEWAAVKRGYETKISTLQTALAALQEEVALGKAEARESAQRAAQATMTARAVLMCSPKTASSPLAKSSNMQRMGDKESAVESEAVGTCEECLGLRTARDKLAAELQQTASQLHKARQDAATWKEACKADKDSVQDMAGAWRSYREDREQQTQALQEKLAAAGRQISTLEHELEQTVTAKAQLEAANENLVRRLDKPDDELVQMLSDMEQALGAAKADAAKYKTELAAALQRKAFERSSWEQITSELRERYRALQNLLVHEEQRASMSPAPTPSKARAAKRIPAPPQLTTPGPALDSLPKLAASVVPIELPGLRETTPPPPRKQRRGCGWQRRKLAGYRTNSSGSSVPSTRARMAGLMNKLRNKRADDDRVPKTPFSKMR